MTIHGAASGRMFDLIALVNRRGRLVERVQLLRGTPAQGQSHGVRCARSCMKYFLSRFAGAPGLFSDLYIRKSYPSLHSLATFGVW